MYSVMREHDGRSCAEHGPGTNTATIHIDYNAVK